MVLRRYRTLLLGLGSLACSRTPRRQAPAVSESTFVAVMTDLRRTVQPGGPALTRDSAGRAALRDSILKKYRVTVPALETTAARLAHDPEHASDLLRVIDQRVQQQNPPPRPIVPGLNRTD